MRKFVFAAVSLCLVSLSLNAEEAKSKISMYGFIRNYAHMDTREIKGLTADLFSYAPVYYAEGSVPDASPTYHFTAITSRLGVNVSGYKYGNASFGAKIEADFYNGLSGVSGTAIFRLRQAYTTIDLACGSGAVSSFKIGQAWHPMAIDMPDIFSLNTGAPFGPFSRTPLLQFDQKFASSPFSLTAAAIWQQQYTHNGPEGSVANYQKYSPIPEFFLGANYKNGGFTGRIGVDMTNIRPYKEGKFLLENALFVYGQYKKGLFSAKLKTVLATDGSQFNLVGGYAVKTPSTDVKEIEFTPTLNSSTWFSLVYGKKTQFILFGGYSKNFGTLSETAGMLTPTFYFGKNTDVHLNQLWRLTPTIQENWGKFTIGIEYEVTSGQYGDTYDCTKGLYNGGLHWITNHRVQTMVKFSF